MPGPRHPAPQNWLPQSATSDQCWTRSRTRSFPLSGGWNGVMRDRVQIGSTFPKPFLPDVHPKPLGVGQRGWGSRGWRRAGSPSTCRGRQGHPPPLCTPAERPSKLPACYLLYKYFLNYQRILVSTFCAWLVSRSEGDRDRIESRTEKETKKGEKEADGEMERE